MNHALTTNRITPVLRLKILDRNAIDLIKRLNKDPSFIPEGETKKELRQKIISLKNTKLLLDTMKITIMLSVIEGQTGMKENYASAYETIKKLPTQTFFCSKPAKPPQQ